MRSTLKSLRILGIVVFLAGVVMIGASQYIKKEVIKGREQIASGEKSVKQGKALFGLNPVSEQVGDAALFDPAEKKIAAGKQEADAYARLADNLQIGGVVAIIVGILLIAYSFRKKKKST